MKRRLLIPLLLGVLSLFLATASVPDTVRAYERPDAVISVPERQIAQTINEYRLGLGLVPLSFDSNLGEAADFHSSDMATTGFFSHTGTGGTSPWARMATFGYVYNTHKGEIIAAGYSSATDVFNAWRASPGHDAIMRGAEFRTMGVGLVVLPGSVFGWYWTIDVGGIDDTSDSDGDGFDDDDESVIGTHDGSACGADHPLDLTNDRIVSLRDVLRFSTSLGTRLGDQNFRLRHDLISDGTIDLNDVALVGVKLGLRTC